MNENKKIEQEKEVVKMPPKEDCKFYRSPKVCSALVKMFCTCEECSFYKKKEDII